MPKPHLPLSMLILLAALGGGCESASFIGGVNAGMSPGTGFRTHEVNVDGRTRRYTVFVPEHYNPRLQWPTIMFLHGLGQAGSDGTTSAAIALGPYIADQAKTFPFIVIFPQSSGGWGDTRDQDDAIAVLDDVGRHYSLDRQRITLTGVSTGGWGTWKVGARYRDRFSCLVPMCGQSDTEDIRRLTNIPIWVFHYETDPIVFASNSKAMADEINQAGGTAKLTLIDGFGHFVWEKAYTPELFRWMAAQRSHAAISTAR